MDAPSHEKLAAADERADPSSLLVAKVSSLGATLIVGLQHHHNTTNKVERVNSVIADVLCSVAGERADDCPALVQQVEFVINDPTSGYTPFYANRGQQCPAPPPPSDIRSLARPGCASGVR